MIKVAHRCEIHVGDDWRMLAAEYKPCGKPAAWYTEDYLVAPRGLHLCEEHQRELSRSVDDEVEFSEVSQ